MSDASKSNSELLLYQTEHGRKRIQCRFEHETVWMTQAQMAELFQTTPQNMTLHLKAIFAEGELAEAATCKDYLRVRPEGRRKPSSTCRSFIRLIRSNCQRNWPAWTGRPSNETLRPPRAQAGGGSAHRFDSVRRPAARDSGVARPREIRHPRVVLLDGSAAERAIAAQTS